MLASVLRWLFKIKTVNSEVTSPSVSSVLLLGGPEPIAAETTYSSNSPSPPQFQFSSSPSRQSFYTDAYSESSHLVPPSSCFYMDTPEARRSSLDGRPLRESSALISRTQLQNYRAELGGSEPQIVVVAVDATKELTLAALEWALKKVVAPGDHLYLLGILHQINNPSTFPLKLIIHAGVLFQLLGYKQKADINSFNGTSKKQLEEEIDKKLSVFQNTSLVQEFYKICELRGVKLKVKIAAGPMPRVVAAKQAVELRATWVILDRHMKKDKKYLMEQLSCNLILMNSKTAEGEIIKLQHSDPKIAAAGKYQEEMSLDTSLTTHHGFLASKGFDQAHVASAAVRDRKVMPRPYASSSPPEFKRTVSQFNQYDLSKAETAISYVDSDTGMTEFSIRPASGAHEDDLSRVDDSMNVLEAGALGGTLEVEFSRPLSQNYHRVWDGAAVKPCIALGPETSSSSYLYAKDRNSCSAETDFLPVKTSAIPSVYETPELRSDNTSPIHVHAQQAPSSEYLFCTSPSREVTDLAEPLSPKNISVLSPASTRPPSAGVDEVDFKKSIALHEYELSTMLTSASPDHFIQSSLMPNLCNRVPPSSDRVKNENMGFIKSRSAVLIDVPSISQTRPTSTLEAKLDEKHVQGQQIPNRQDTESPADELKRIMNPTKTAHVEAPTPRARTPLNEMNALLGTATSRGPSPFLYSLLTEDEQCLADLNHSSYGRKKRVTPAAPPLCSVCKHKPPELGRAPRKFSYAELEEATDNFSPDNFLAEGGFGFVYKGRLKEGQEVAVKQHKLASSKGDNEFCSEVEVLSCAQHRNLVTLIGYCAENRRRLLVYEYVCNGSLDYHLSPRNPVVLDWNARQKIAVGAARAMRYLHEECRVGCIVHRDMRPNNILLTHDFMPMVGDFGLARWQPSGDQAEETRVIGTLGYLAPEYAESGQITEKADVYSFGVVLLELITGRKAIDATRSRGQTCLTEWARPLVETRATHELLDPRLDYYEDYELNQMVIAASYCIRKNPAQRPKMSQVLRFLEGDAMTGARDGSPPQPLTASQGRGLSRTGSVPDFNKDALTYSQYNLATSLPSIPRQVSLDSNSPSNSPSAPHHRQVSVGTSPPLTRSDFRLRETQSGPILVTGNLRAHKTDSPSLLGGFKQAPSQLSPAKGPRKLSYNNML